MIDTIRVTADSGAVVEFSDQNTGAFTVRHEGVRVEFGNDGSLFFSGVEAVRVVNFLSERFGKATMARANRRADEYIA